jgi:DNA invertase Pin-like site-specific DNA recombinase
MDEIRASQSTPAALDIESASFSRLNARGLIICETYLDAGVSGGTLERPALRRLLADCRAGKIDLVFT